MNSSFTISYENCRYRGEGNSSLVVSLEKEAKVLRLKKDDNSSNESGSTDNTKRLLESQNEFANNIMKPLLGSAFVPYSVIVHLSADDVKIINKVITGHRPANRSVKNIREAATQALLLLDCCLLSPNLSKYMTKGPLMSIEIKPKQGFLPCKDSLMKDHAIMTKVCRFCMTQYHKLAKGAVKSRSGYCPLDLFSGSPKRMKYALTELLNSPQNNLRIFEDRKLVFSEENKAGLYASLENFFKKGCIERNKDNFCTLVTQALLSVFPYEMHDKRAWNITTEHKQQFCINSGYSRCQESISHLPVGCILDRILHIQKLDSLDITCLYQMFLKVKEQLPNDIDNIGAVNTSTEYPNNQLPMNAGKRVQHASENEYTYMTRKIWEFLVALTAKDFSLMLTIQELHANTAVNVPAEHLLHENDSKKYIFSFAIMDLDAKSISKVEKVYHDTIKIIEAYCKGQGTSSSIK